MSYLDRPVATGSTPGVVIPGFGTAMNADGKSLDARIAARMAGVFNAVLDGGAVADGSTNTLAALTSAYIASQVYGMRLFLPPGEYFIGAGTWQIGGAGLYGLLNTSTGQWTYTTSGTAGAVALNGRVDVFGIPGRTTVRNTNTGAGAVIQYGNGTQLPDGIGNHRIEGIRTAGPGLYGTTPVAKSGAVGFLGSAMTHTLLEKCFAVGLDIGFRLTNNCYATRIQDPRTDGCHCGIDLPSDANAGCGNQIYIYNPWTSGDRVGINVGAPVNGSPNIDGIYIFGGQVGATGTDDTFGNIRFGIDYLTESTGGVGQVEVSGVDMEGWHSWGVRGFGQGQIVVRGCPMIVYGGTTAMGVFKATNWQAGNVRLETLSVRGAFTSAQAVVLAGSFGVGNTREIGTYLGAADCTFNSVAVPRQGQSLLIQSQLTRGTYTGVGSWLDGVEVELKNGTLTKSVAGALSTSTDWGVTWNALATTAQLTALISSPANVAYLNALPTIAAAGLPFAAYDASLIKGADATVVGAIHDLSGWGNSLTQPTAALRPKLKAAGINSKNVLWFNSAGSSAANSCSLLLPNALNVPQEFLTALGGSDFTIAFVAAPISPIPTASTQGVGAFIGTTDGQNGMMAIVDNYTSANLYAMRITAGSLAFAPSIAGTAGTVSKFILTYVASTGVLSLYVDAAAATTQTITANTSAWNGLALGYSYSPNQYSGNMYFCEAAFFAGVPVAAELTNLKSYLKTKWGGA